MKHRSSIHAESVGEKVTQKNGPITVMTWAPQDTNLTNKPGMPAFARAYARWVNSHGGIDGRKLHVASCNERNDSVSAAKCARAAVSLPPIAPARRGQEQFVKYCTNWGYVTSP